MSHPVQKNIEDYMRMRNEFANAIALSGGCVEVILNQPEWISVLSTLVANNIVITANWVGAHPTKSDSTL